MRLEWLLPIVFVACGPRMPTSPGEVRLMQDVRALAAPSLNGRRAGTEDEAAALAYVRDALNAANITTQAQPFAISPGRESHNLLGVIRGSTGLADEYVVLGAHVDHLGVVEGALHPGAEDNATGVALVLEVGRRLMERRAALGRTVVLAFFGAEEIGKLGSTAYVQDPPLSLERTVAMVNVDMIGLPLLDQSAMWILKVLWGLDDHTSVGIVGTAGRPGLRALVNEGCRRARISSVAPEDFPAPVEDMINEQAADRSDDAPFRRAGVPAVIFGSGEADSYHSADDVVDAIHPDILADRTEAVLETVMLLSRADWDFVRRSGS